MKHLLAPVTTSTLLCCAGVLAAAGLPAGESTQPSVGKAAPVSKLQGEALEGYQQRFNALDSNGDGHISRSEAQASPALAAYWKHQDLGPDATMDRSAFLKYEAKAETGTDVYKPERSTPGGYPATRHQRQAIDSDND